MADCLGLMGLPEEELGRRFGRPIARRVRSGDTWLVYETAAFVLRVRCAGERPGRVASWTATFATGHATLEKASRALGLWPAAGPDHVAETSAARLIRRPLSCPPCGQDHSLTATVRAGRIVGLSVFDEPPEWL